MRRFLSLRSTSQPGPASPEPEKSVAPSPDPASQLSQSQPSVPSPVIVPPSSQPVLPPVPAGLHYQNRNRRGQRVIHEDGPEDDDEHSTAPLITEPAVPPPPPNLKVKRVDYVWSSWSKAWKYRNTSAKVRPDDALKTVGNGTDDGNDPWQGFCFVVVRKVPQSGEKENQEPTFQVHMVPLVYIRSALHPVVTRYYVLLATRCRPGGKQYVKWLPGRVSLG